MQLSQDFINQYHEAPDPAKYAKSVARAGRLFNILWNLRIINAEKVPLSGATIMAFQHRSYRDPWIYGTSTPRAIMGMGKAELLNWYYLGFGSSYLTNRGFTFVTRDGDVSREEMEYSYEVLRKRKALAVAPEGTSENRGRKIGKTKQGIGRLVAKMTAEGIETVVVPVAVASDTWKIGDSIPIVFGDLITAPTEVTTIRQRKQSAKDTNEELVIRLQELSDISYDLRETA